MRTPRPYQTAAVDKIKQLWSSGKRRVVVVAPVGAGKTYIAELLIVPTLKHKWAQVFFCAHTESLLDQPAQRFTSTEMQAAYIKAGRAADPTAMLQFCSAQTLCRRDIVPQHTRAVIFVDECHRVKSSTYIEILNKFNQLFKFVYIVYLTATPYRLDGRGLADVADVQIEVATPKQLMGRAAFPDGSTLQRPVILPPLYWAEPLPEGDTEEVVSRPGIVGDVVKSWQQRGQGQATICRAYSLDHSKLLVERFRSAGIRAAHIDGTMTTAQRRRLLVELSVVGHPDAIDILCAGSNIFDEGFDSRASYELLLPRTIDALEAWRVLRDPTAQLGPLEALLLRRRVLDGVLPELRDFWPLAESGLPMEPPLYRPLCCLIDAAPTASCGAWMQRQGRVVRAWYGDDEETAAARSWQGLPVSVARSAPVVLCHSGNLDRHGALIHHEGFPFAVDAIWSPKLKPGNGVSKLHVPLPRTCPNCLSIDVERTGTCLYCGVATTEPNLPDERPSVELVAREAAPAVSTPGTREAFLKSRYVKWLSINRDRAAEGKPPYKAGWPLVQFKSRFGFWPDMILQKQVRAQLGIRG
ncbi:MAG: DEAD/DEAH box helicase [Desulfurellales bacterium]|nr:MAG: DEAD/DEAH box helicase [Desulfurellales bacterium]